MKLKKVTDLGANEVIHCKTEKEAKAICQLMHDAGLKWKSDTSYLDYEYLFSIINESCTENSIYFMPKIGEWRAKYQIKNEHTIYPAKDFLTLKVTKKELLNRIEKLERMIEIKENPIFSNQIPLTTNLQIPVTESEKEKVLLYLDMLGHARSVNGDWLPDWDKLQDTKWTLDVFDGLNIDINSHKFANQGVFGIAYQTRESAEQAKEKFSERILKYYGN